MWLSSRKPQLDLSRLQPTSKMALKLTCLSACDNDVRAAQELYTFIAGGLELPDLEPDRPTTMGQIRKGADDVFTWVQEHKDGLLQGYQFIQGLRSAAAKATPIANEVPPIPNL